MTDKLYAILDDGNFDGDSYFQGIDQALDYTEGMSLEDLKKEFAQKYAVDMYADGYDELDDSEKKEIDDIIKKIKLAWIIDQKAADTASAVFPNHIGNDGALYAAMAASKRVIDKMALKTLR